VLLAADVTGGMHTPPRPEFERGAEGAEPDKADEVPPPAPVFAISTKGFIADSKLNLLIRSYAEDLHLVGIDDRRAWVQGVQALFQSGFTEGPVGFGADATLDGAFKFDGGNGARNMVHVARSGEGADQRTWAALGEYVIKAATQGMLVKYGLQTTFFNPFLEPYDIRALPPTFRGVSIVDQPGSAIMFKAGSFDAVMARGSTFLTSLSTSYGGVDFKRLNYLGGEWNDSDGSRVALYASQAKDVWNQFYASAAYGIGDPARLKWTARADLYYTCDQGRRLQGLINNKSFSVMLTAQQGPSRYVVGYQRIMSEQYFDFAQESSGIVLSNSAAVDFNAPNEQSFQLRYKFDAAAVGVPGMQTNVWAIFGWGADGTSGARRYAAPSSLLHNLYWKRNQPIGGSEQEYGVKAIYTRQSGRLTGMNIALSWIAHHETVNYPSKIFRDVRLVIDWPVKVF
jgi:hypothetical protein